MHSSVLDQLKYELNASLDYEISQKQFSTHIVSNRRETQPTVADVGNGSLQAKVNVSYDVNELERYRKELIKNIEQETERIASVQNTKRRILVNS